MLARGDISSAKYIVDTAELERLSVEGGCPSRIVNFGEYNDAASSGFYFILQFIRLIAEEGDLGKGVDYGRAGMVEYTAEGLVGHGLRTQIGGGESSNLFIWRCDIVDGIDKPRVAHGEGILHGKLTSLASADDKVFVVEHIEHREEAVALDGSKVALTVVEGLDDSVHLGADMSVDEVLIASELDCAIATDALVKV